MPRFIKAHDNPDSTTFEFAVTSRNPRRARTRATLTLLGRMPGQATAVRGVDVVSLEESGFLNHYRVSIEIKDSADLKSILRLDKALRAVEDTL